MLPPNRFTRAAIAAVFLGLTKMGPLPKSRSITYGTIAADRILNCVFDFGANGLVENVTVRQAVWLNLNVIRDNHG